MSIHISGMKPGKATLCGQCDPSGYSVIPATTIAGAQGVNYIHKVIKESVNCPECLAIWQNRGMSVSLDQLIAALRELREHSGIASCQGCAVGKSTAWARVMLWLAERDQRDS